MNLMLFVFLPKTHDDDHVVCVEVVEVILLSHTFVPRTYATHVGVESREESIGGGLYCLQSSKVVIQLVSKLGPWHYHEAKVVGCTEQCILMQVLSPVFACKPTLSCQ